MKNLWKFKWDCGRSGDISGLFVATQSEIDNLIGKTVYFGEVLGKHSEVSGTIEECEIKKVDVDEDTIKKVTMALGNTWCGYNPLQYIDEEESEEED